MPRFFPAASVVHPETHQAIIGSADVTANNRAYFERAVRQGNGEIRADKQQAAAAKPPSKEEKK